MTTSPHLALARRRYGRRAAWIVGDGPHAVLAWCRSLTVALYDDEAEARAALASIGRHGCSGRCHGEHELVLLDPTPRKDTTA